MWSKDDVDVIRREGVSPLLFLFLFFKLTKILKKDLAGKLFLNGNICISAWPQTPIFFIVRLILHSSQLITCLKRASSASKHLENVTHATWTACNLTPASPANSTPRYGLFSDCCCRANRRSKRDEFRVFAWKRFLLSDRETCETNCQRQHLHRVIWHQLHDIDGSLFSWDSEEKGRLQPVRTSFRLRSDCQIWKPWRFLQI